MILSLQKIVVVLSILVDQYFGIVVSVLLNELQTNKITRGKLKISVFFCRILLHLFA